MKNKSKNSLPRFLSVVSKGVRILGLSLIFGLIGFSANAQNWNEIIKFGASDPVPEGLFGTSVSMDGNLLIVGASGDDNNNLSSVGAAYIFELSEGTWTQTAKLIPSIVLAYQYFGISVAISGNRVIIGAIGNDDNGTSSGISYIFELSGGTWTETAILSASDADEYDNFGGYVSISGNRVIVAANGNSDYGTFTGSAYIFELSGGTWTETAKLLASDATTYDVFGCDVSISGDKAVVGAFQNDANGITDAGAAYVFELSGGSWTETAKLSASDAQMTDNFGRTVSISGNRVIACAPGDDVYAASSGSAYVFELNEGIWTQTAKLFPASGNEYDWFGKSVAQSGDKAIIGSYLYDLDPGAPFGHGAAFIYELDDGGIWQETKLAASDSSAFEYFGEAVTISGNNAIVSQIGDTDVSSQMGSVYFFEKDVINSLPDVSVVEDKSIFLSPNPFTNEFSLKVNSDRDEKLFIRINNLTGKLVYETTEYFTNQHIELGEVLNSGLYIMQLQYGSVIESRKLLKK